MPQFYLFLEGGGQKFTFAKKLKTKNFHSPQKNLKFHLKKIDPSFFAVGCGFLEVSDFY